MSLARTVPRVGMPATVRYLALDVAAVVTSVGEGGLAVTARTDEGETIEFRLNRAKAVYQAPGDGPRLRLGPLAETGFD